ncbi:hypothetical protein F5X68DRAFT_227467 [Plectosphaerella plurivora]|uniref:Integral membrane protein n=1 Tax=Plectosphaerella plurivora TaxID=936078 RepID=A0A9P9AEV9_9PEZI|nr:hypothetical protein F5X68DRAFT_227467 [Plectosphaerella plurivora]
MIATRAHAGFWLFWLLLLAFCYFNSRDDPSSIFYDESTAYDQRYSLVRAAQAAEYLNNVPEKPAQTDDQGKFLCMGIPSVNRTNGEFLSTAVATLTDSLTPDERASIHIIVLLAGKNPAEHYGYGKPWLRNIADEVLVYGDLPADSKGYRQVPFDVRPGHPRGDGHVEAVRSDYSTLVEACRAKGSEYFALVEDDIIAAPVWFARLKSGLEYVEERARETKRRWIYLRLFYSEVFMGWNNEEWRTYAKVIFVIYAVVVLGFVARVIFRRRFRLGPRAPPGPMANSSTLYAALILTLWMPALIALYFLAGRVSVNRLNPLAWSRHGVREMPRYGCCAQGLVFSSRELKGVQAVFREPPFNYAGDMVLEDYANKHQLTKWALEPSVLQHLGIKASSGGEMRTDVWNFSFERQKHVPEEA